MIEVISPGFFTTIQDLGRKNYRSYGFPESGAMDDYNACLANWLVNNAADVPVLEVTMTGPVLKFNNACIIGITGADMSPELNNKVIGSYHSIEVHPGDVLTLKNSTKGFRTYISVSGGFTGDKFLNSCSTYALAEIGGFKGRKLLKGDILDHPKRKQEKNKIKIVPEHLQTKFDSNSTIRVLEGPEFDLILEDSPMGLAGIFKIHLNSDRMGIRLSGFFGDVNKKEIISSPVTKGTIQLFPDNNLIVLMNDGQVTGGYPRLGNVISADLHLLAQMKPGDEVKLLPISLAEAHHLWWHQQNLLKPLFP